MPATKPGQPIEHAAPSPPRVVMLLASILAALVVVIVLLVVIIVGGTAAPPSHEEPLTTTGTITQTPASTPTNNTPPAVATSQGPNPSPSFTPAGRSAIPQPGETFAAPIPPQKLNHGVTQTESPAAGAPEPKSIIPWTLAHQHVGQTITVEGRVIDTHNTGSVCFLNFVRDRESFYIIIFKDSLNAWPQPPESHFLNKTIRVTGTVSERSGRTQIQVRQPSQIAVVP